MKSTDEMTPAECLDWLEAVYINRGFAARAASPAALRVAKVRAALEHLERLEKFRSDIAREDLGFLRGASRDIVAEWKRQAAVLSTE